MILLFFRCSTNYCCGLAIISIIERHERCKREQMCSFREEKKIKFFAAAWCCWAILISFEEMWILWVNAKKIHSLFDLFLLLLCLFFVLRMKSLCCFIKSFYSFLWRFTYTACQVGIVGDSFVFLWISTLWFSRVRIWFCEKCWKGFDLVQLSYFYYCEWV